MFRFWDLYFFLLFKTKIDNIFMLPHSAKSRNTLKLKTRDLQKIRRVLKTILSPVCCKQQHLSRAFSQLPTFFHRQFPQRFRVFFFVYVLCALYVWLTLCFFHIMILPFLRVSLFRRPVILKIARPLNNKIRSRVRNDSR